MKVLLINGSPHKEGSTHAALTEVAGAIEREGIETEIMWLGDNPIYGCLGCFACMNLGRCVIDDKVNLFLEKAKQVDGLVLGSPVHYAAASGALTSFLDRAFFASRGILRGKVGAAVVCCRRGGATAAFDQINKYFGISGMPTAPSQYWNMVHGNSPEDVKQDLEGLQTMRTLGLSMAWMIKCIHAGRDAGIELPEMEPRVSTNFIR